ncbi:hypothetical protein WG66_009142 [Moniliophthora roreri]|nr:hypothetical protein WG66_009142 [Moniliophthora roreri]
MSRARYALHHVERNVNFIAFSITYNGALLIAYQGFGTCSVI